MPVREVEDALGRSGMDQLMMSTAYRWLALTSRDKSLVYFALIAFLHPTNQSCSFVPALPGQKPVVIGIYRGPNLSQRLLWQTGGDQKGESAVTREDTRLDVSDGAGLERLTLSLSMTENS